MDTPEWHVQSVTSEFAAQRVITCHPQARLPTGILQKTWQCVSANKCTISDKSQLILFVHRPLSAHAIGCSRVHLSSKANAGALQSGPESC